MNTNELQTLTRVFELTYFIKQSRESSFPGDANVVNHEIHKIAYKHKLTNLGVACGRIHQRTGIQRDKVPEKLIHL